MSAIAGQDTRQPEQRPKLRPAQLLLSLALNGGVPLLVYTLLRPHVGGDATALAVGAAIPVTVTLVRFAWRRRVDPIGVVAAAGFGIVLLVSLLSGGNVLVLKLQEAVVTGPLGLVCLVSVAVGRPLHLVVLRLLARRDPKWARATDPDRSRMSGVVTTIVGAMLVVHALVLLVLALTESTATFLAVSRPVGLSIIVAGVAVLMLYRRGWSAGAGAADRGRA
jgi:hypothetical protein